MKTLRLIVLKELETHGPLPTRYFREQGICSTESARRIMLTLTLEGKVEQHSSSTNNNCVWCLIETSENSDPPNANTHAIGPSEMDLEELFNLVFCIGNHTSVQEIRKRKEQFKGKVGAMWQAAYDAGKASANKG
ncbi:hypothetical protein [Neptuniibacter sp. QD37_11]|uniref:hypothetical protein n=1 Tax=Neptuniibacter sp. QD37_11 TaxID=3398209 RepID=UPI0039F47179